MTLGPTGRTEGGSSCSGGSSEVRTDTPSPAPQPSGRETEREGGERGPAMGRQVERKRERGRQIAEERNKEVHFEHLKYIIASLLFDPLFFHFVPLSLPPSSSFFLSLYPS